MHALVLAPPRSSLHRRSGVGRDRRGLLPRQDHHDLCRHRAGRRRGQLLSDGARAGDPEIHPGQSQRRGLAHAGRRRHQGGDLHRERRRRRTAPPGASSPAASCWRRCSSCRRRISSRRGSTGSAAPRAPSRWAWCWNAWTPVRTIQDAMQKEVVVGATSIAQDTGIFPRALNRVLGTKFKIVTGYASLGAVDIAMERGEVHGKVGSTWKSLNSGPSAHWVQGQDRQRDRAARRRRRRPTCRPTCRSRSTSPRPPRTARCSRSCARRARTGYPSFMGPGVPKERVDGDPHRLCGRH